jgi:hypothetical protein
MTTRIAPPPPSPTLLTLPTELRLKILKCAFILTCAPSTPPATYPSALDIQLIFHLDQPTTRSSIESRHEWDGSWGTRQFGDLFVINKKLYRDAVAVVYAGDFVFHVPEGVEETDVRRWLQIVGEKKRLIGQVGVFVWVSLNLLIPQVGGGRAMSNSSTDILHPKMPEKSILTLER